MKVGVISDTHGSLNGWEKSWELLKNTDIVIHCGDIFNHGPGNPLPEGYSPKKLLEIINTLEKPILIAKGNCDSEVDQMFLSIPICYPYIFSVIKNYPFLISHGHLFKDNFIEIGKKWKVNFLISGHTHIWELEKKDNIIILNPGSPSLPKNDPSCAVIDLESKKAQVFEINKKQLLKEETF